MLLQSAVDTCTAARAALMAKAGAECARAGMVVRKMSLPGRRTAESFKGAGTRRDLDDAEALATRHVVGGGAVRSLLARCPLAVKGEFSPQVTTE